MFTFYAFHFLLSPGRLFRSILTSLLFSPFHTPGIQHPSHNVIAHSRQILYPPPSNQHNRVLLEIVPFPWDIGGHLHSIAQANPCNLSQRRVWFLGSGSEHAQTHSSFERRGVGNRLILLRVETKRQGGGSVFLFCFLASVFNELVNSGHPFNGSLEIMKCQSS